MRLLTGKRIGQSGGELSAAVLFSFFIHVFVFFAAFFLSLHAQQRTYEPPFYRVNLVGLPADLPVAPSMTTPASQSLPPAPKPAAKQEPPKAKHVAAPKAKALPAPKSAAAGHAAMPELATPARTTQQKTEGEAPKTAAPASGAGKQTVSVAVAVAGDQPDFPFAPYVAIVRDKVERNWNPPPGVKGTKVKVKFTVLRSGRVGEAVLQEASGNFYFDQAAMRAILSSSPFPPLPEGFFRDDETFSVDLMEKE